jgi:hypothetical protein
MRCKRGSGRANELVGGEDRERAVAKQDREVLAWAEPLDEVKPDLERDHRQQPLALQAAEPELREECFVEEAEQRRDKVKRIK